MFGRYLSHFLCFDYISESIVAHLRKSRRVIERRYLKYNFAFYFLPIPLITRSFTEKKENQVGTLLHRRRRCTQEKGNRNDIASLAIQKSLFGHGLYRFPVIKPSDNLKPEGKTLASTFMDLWKF